MILLFDLPHTEDPCPMCAPFLTPDVDRVRLETVLPLAAGAGIAPRSRTTGARICFDCAATEALQRHVGGMTFEMARIAIGNDRQERLRLPGHFIGLPFGRASAVGDLDTLHDWHRRVFGTEDHRAAVRDDAKLEKGGSR